jgi:hypothetical protein
MQWNAQKRRPTPQLPVILLLLRLRGGTSMPPQLYEHIIILDGMRGECYGLVK